MSTLTKRERSIAAKYRRILRAKADGEAAYARARQITMQLAQVMKVGLPVRISTTTSKNAVELRDAWLDAIDKAKAKDAKAAAEGKNTLHMPEDWNAAASRRYFFEEVTLDE